MFLGSCLVLFVSLRAYGHLLDKLDFIKKWSSHASSIVFLVLEVLPVLFEEGFSPFSLGPFIFFFLLIFISRLC